VSEIPSTSRRQSPARRHCCFFSLVDSLVTVFSAGASGLAGSDLTSTLRVVLLDSDVVLGVGAACAGAGAAVAVGGTCWQPASVKPKAATAIAAVKLKEYRFILLILCSCLSCSPQIHGRSAFRRV
jgi:hypothetical protein